MAEQKMIRVCPVAGRSLPIEATPTRRVDREMDVPDRVYYRRAIRRGDIERVPSKPTKARAKSKPAASTGEER